MHKYANCSIIYANNHIINIQGDIVMLNRNIFFTLVFGFFASTSVYADNPGTEEVASTPVAETSDVQEEVAMEASVSETPSSAADDSDSVELTKVSVTGSRIKRTDIEGPNH